MDEEKLIKALREFKVQLLPTNSPETIRRNVSRVAMFARRGMDPFNIDETWLWEYCASQLEASKKKNSMRIEMNDLARWVDFTGQTVRIPKFKREAEQDPWFPSEQEYKEVLRTCSLKFKESLRDYLREPAHQRKWFKTALIIRVLAEGGMRVSELLKMNLDERREKGYFIRSSKGEKDRFVALSPSTLEMIDRYVKEFRENTDMKALWTGEYGRLKPAVIRKLVKEAGIAAGVAQLHPHAMRHYCATRLLKMGVDMRKVQIHLGHGSIKSTQRYTHMLSSDVQGEIYDLYSGVREHDFFEYEEAIAI